MASLRFGWEGARASRCLARRAAFTRRAACLHAQNVCELGYGIGIASSLRVLLQDLAGEQRADGSVERRLRAREAAVDSEPVEQTLVLQKLLLRRRRRVALPVASFLHHVPGRGPVVLPNRQGLPLVVRENARPLHEPWAMSVSRCPSLPRPVEEVGPGRIHDTSLVVLPQGQLTQRKPPKRVAGPRRHEKVGDVLLALACQAASPWIANEQYLGVAEKIGEHRLRFRAWRDIEVGIDTSVDVHVKQPCGVCTLNGFGVRVVQPDAAW